MALWALAEVWRIRGMTEFGFLTFALKMNQKRLYIENDRGFQNFRRLAVRYATGMQSAKCCSL
jgi:hypothetical protein